MAGKTEIERKRAEIGGAVDQIVEGEAETEPQDVLMHRVAGLGPKCPRQGEWRPFHDRTEARQGVYGGGIGRDQVLYDLHPLGSRAGPDSGFELSRPPQAALEFRHLTQQSEGLLFRLEGRRHSSGQIGSNPLETQHRPAGNRSVLQSEWRVATVCGPRLVGAQHVDDRCPRKDQHGAVVPTAVRMAHPERRVGVEHQRLKRFRHHFRAPGMPDEHAPADEDDLVSARMLLTATAGSRRAAPDVGDGGMRAHEERNGTQMGHARSIDAGASFLNPQAPGPGKNVKVRRERAPHIHGERGGVARSDSSLQLTRTADVTTEGAMISRVWRGWTTRDDAATYERLLLTTIFPGIQGRSNRGYRGIELHRRLDGDRVEFMTIMRFDSLDDVRAFAGEDYEIAVVPAVARDVLLDFDARSAHFDIVHPAPA